MRGQPGAAGGTVVGCNSSLAKMQCNTHKHREENEKSLPYSAEQTCDEDDGAGHLNDMHRTLLSPKLLLK